MKRLQKGVYHVFRATFVRIIYLKWQAMVERVRVPALGMWEDPTAVGVLPHKNTLQTSLPVEVAGRRLTIREWCLNQDAVAVIGRYVVLDEKGMGCCPFGWHHTHGQDRRASLWVYRPHGTDVCCWYCHVWQQGGALFDFLRSYYGLDARALWQRILSGVRF